VYVYVYVCVYAYVCVCVSMCVCVLHQQNLEMLLRHLQQSGYRVAHLAVPDVKKKHENKYKKKQKNANSWQRKGLQQVT